MHWNLNLVRITNHYPTPINQNNESRSIFVDKSIHLQRLMGQPSNPGRGYMPRFPKRKPVKKQLLIQFRASDQNKNLHDQPSYKTNALSILACYNICN